MRIYFAGFNDAQMEIAISNHLLEEKATASVIEGTSDYSMPVDVLEIWALRWDNYKLKSMSMEQVDEYITNSEDSHQYQTGKPAIWWSWRNTISLYPIPDSNLAAGLTVYYSRLPKQVTADADVPELPVKYHTRIVDYCLKQAYELDEDYSASSLKGQELNADLNDMLETEKWASRDFYPTITVLADDL